tara:strand:- start:221 stop:574 length:354 start_codon:yes stop_codon:yes gene_type:complete
MRVEYSSNNSGGNWWLSDDDWKALEKAGWRVDWCINDKSFSKAELKDGRWLGALAKRAEKEGVSSLREAVEEWEKVTGESSTDAGCPCCGQPHYFTFYDDNGDYVDSGPETSYDASW